MKMTAPVMIPMEKLHPFEGQPFKVRDDEEMEKLTESVMTQGILAPLLVRPMENAEDGYEIVSGHRRVRAAQKAGMKEVPAIVTELDRTEAIIALVDSNLHREHLLPSEKAFAYRMKMDAMKRQGRRTDLTLGQLVPKSEANRTTAEIGAKTGEGYKTVQRYIRLTYLIPELLDMVDEGEIALTPAVELSYLTENEQRAVLNAAEYEDCTPSLSQAIQLKNLSRDGKLTMIRVAEIMAELKPNQEEKISFRMKDIRKFFPKNYSAEKIQTTMLQLMQNYQRKHERDEHSR